MTTNIQTSLKLGNRLTALTELLVVDQLVGLVTTGRFHAHLIRVTKRNETRDEVSLRSVDRLGNITSIETLHDESGQPMGLTRQNELLHGKNRLLDAPLLSIRNDIDAYAIRVVLRSPVLVGAVLQQAAHHGATESALTNEQIVHLDHLVDLAFHALALEEISSLLSEVHGI